MLRTSAIPFPLQENAYDPQSYPYEHPGLIQIADLEGDGTREVVFVAQPRGQHHETQLYCFEHDGRERFRHAPTASVVFGNEVESRPITTEMKQQPDEGVWVTVQQAAINNPPNEPSTASVHYRLNTRFEIVDQRLGDDYVREHTLLNASGRILYDAISGWQ